MERQIGFFESQFFPYLLENNITEVLQLGDTHDSRKYSLNQMLSEIGQRYFRWFNKNKVTLYTLVGNHDSPNRDNANYSPLYQHKSKYIVPIKHNKIVEIDGKSFALHSYFCKDFLQADVGCFHHDFKDFRMNKHTICEEGVEFPDIDYEKVYSGHYHSSADKMYLKTPYQLSFESFGDENGFIVLDTDTMEETFVKNTCNQIFLKVYYYSKDNIVIKDGKNETVHNIKSALETIKDNFVEINIEHIDDKIVLDKFIEDIQFVEYRYNNYFLKTEEIEDKETFIEADFNNIEELYSGFVKTIDNDIPELVDKELMKDEFLEIYRESKTEDI
jgi:hypothetical protein